MSEPIIRTKNLEVTYNIGQSNEFRALHGETLEIYPQEYIILFGPSGCGKSTLLYTILGALPPSNGLLTVKGENPYAYSAERMVTFQQETIGIIYQSFNLIPSLNVLDNVALPMIFAGVSPAEREKRANELLKQFGVDFVAKKLSSMLSGGQSQRVAVARSLINDPEILLADEPVGNLDSISAEQVMDMLADINERGKKTVILVTHDARYLPYAHRVFYVRDGRLEREVANPEKSQIKKTIGARALVTEIEKLSRLYPYDSQDALRVKSIVNFLTQEMTFDQVERLESSIKLIMGGRIDLSDFYLRLTMGYNEGGVGIAQKIAQEMTEKMRRIYDQSVDIQRYRREVSHNDYSSQRKLIEKIRMYLMDEYRGQVTHEQVKRLEDAISSRISGIIQKDDFQRKLETPLEEGGLKIDRPDARHMTLYLEKLIAQGVKQ
jgi:putative ABC transport system ATP-binding protein